MTFFRQYALRRICAATVAAALMVQPLAVYAAAIVPALAQVPLQGVNPVRPNLMFTLDDSGSMDFEFVPDYVQYYASLDGTGNHYFCLNQKSAAGGRICGWATNTWGGGGSAVAQISDPPVRSSDFNHQYYDPTVEYAVGVTETRTALPFQATADWTQVYSDAFDNYPPPGLPTVKVNLTSAYPDTIWCWKSATTPAQKLTADLPGGDGSYCRRNGYAYPANAVVGTTAVSAGYNYPNRSDGLNCKNTLGIFDCPLQSTATDGAPYYYTISKVQFCNSQDASPAGPLLLNYGFGTGTCSPQPPEAPTLSSRWGFVNYPYVRYGTDPSNAFQPSAFKRVDITPTFLVNGVPAANPTGRSYADEMNNFAKWYAFYRTRINSMKTGAGLAFTVLDSTNARVGYHTIHNNGFLNVKLFDATQKAAWFKALYNATANGGTPLTQAMWRIGQLFSNPTTGAWTNTSGIGGALDPLDQLTGACQDNFHLLSTDGYWNQVLTAAQALTVGDLDKTVPATLPATGTGDPIRSAYPPKPDFVSGSNFPGGYFEGPVAISNNLADLGMKYWINDIRKDFANRVGGADSEYPWQKVVFYGLSLGAQGNIRYLPGTPDPVVLKDIINPPSPCPPGAICNWPSSPKQPPNISGGTVQDAGQEAIDDLWHAAVNGRGGFANADSPQKLAKEIARVIDAVILQNGTGTGVSTAGGQLSLSNQFGYKTRYNDPDPKKDWSGDVKKYRLNLATGEVIPTPLIWSAKAQLDAQAAVDPVTLLKGWDVDRRIATMKGTTPVPFRYDSLSGAQQTSLTVGWTGVLPMPDGHDVLNYLRGDPSHYGTEVNSLRSRTHILGDIVYSAAVPVGPPNLPYDDSTNPGYGEFKTTKAGRMPMVYVGANDGMVHAILDPTSETDPLGGKEAWAYVPGALFGGGDPNDTAHTPSADFQLGALAYQIGGIPLFKHKSYVNATPRVWDIAWNNTNVSNVSGPPPATGGDWKTILVGGLGVGGRAVYALDVTDPVAADEAAAVGKVLWEFNTINAAPFGDPNLGYVYDAPTLVKTRAKGWVALIVSGYNNVGGKGFLYVVNPKTGEYFKKISLPGDTGTDIAPTGLSTVRAFVQSRKDPYVSQAYGGDLKGNVWRFDLSDPTDIGNWKAEKIAALTDKAGKAQPITAGIRIEIDQNNNNRYIFVGTGKLLGQADVGATTVWNTMYVIRDGNVLAPDPKPATPYAAPSPRVVPPASTVCPVAPNTLCAVDATKLTGFTGTLGRGWYQDATAADQYIVTDPFADLQTAVFAFAKPATDPCAPPLSATLFAREFTSGDSVLEALGGTTVIVSAEIVEGIAGLQLVQGADPGNGVMPVSAQITDMGGQVFSYGIHLTGGPSGKHRVSWRVLNN